MDADCLNADKPDMFLAIKNVLKLNIVQEEGPNADFTRLLKESFDDPEPQLPTPAQTAAETQSALPRSQSSNNLALGRKRQAAEKSIS
jgi:hypothetical protein